MKKIILAISSVLISIMFFSCEKDVILDITPGENDPIVEAWIYEGSGPLVMLGKQFAGYGTFDQASLADSLSIKNAIVRVGASGGTMTQLVEQNIYELPQDLLEQFLDANRIPRDFSQALPLFANLTEAQQIALIESNFPNEEDQEEKEAAIAFLEYTNNLNFYIDTTNAFVGQGGMSYDLEADIDGNVLSAITTIPTKQDINFLTYEIDPDNDTLAQVKINLTVPNNFDAFVLLATKRNDDAFHIPDYFGGGLSDNGIYAGSGTITLPLLRGYGNDEDVDINDLGLYVLGDEVTLKWQNIDEATYNFWFSVFNDGGDTPFSSATLIQGNIENGFGIWAGYNTSYTTIQIQ